MYGSFLYNCWAALFAFTISFLIMLVNASAVIMPLPTMGIALLWAFVGFVGAYGLRGILYYILYTPKMSELVVSSDAEQTSSAIHPGNDVLSKPSTSTVEFSDESTEDIAQVVRTMLSKEEPIINNS